MLFRCLLSSIVSDEKSAIILVMIPLCIMCLSVFWGCQGFLCIFGFSNVTMTCPGVVFFVFIVF